MPNTRGVLLIAFLHHNKIISDARMKVMINMNRKMILNRYRKSYHCPIDGKWYNNQDTFRVIWKILEETPDLKWEMLYEEFKPYIKLHINGNDNYCLKWFKDYILSQTVNNAFSRESSDAAIESLLNSFGIKKFQSKLYTLDYKAHYCCKECHGSEHDWITIRKQPYIKKYQKEVNAEFDQALSEFRDKTWENYLKQKYPNQKWNKKQQAIQNDMIN